MTAALSLTLPRIVWEARACRIPAEYQNYTSFKYENEAGDRSIDKER